MRFSQAFLAVLSVTGTSAVIFSNDAADYNALAVGSAFTFKIADYNSACSIYLGTGSSNNLQFGSSPIATCSGGTCSSWTPTSGGPYSFKVVDSSNSAGANGSPATNYIGPYTIAGPTAGTTTTPTSTGSTTTAPSQTKNHTTSATSTITSQVKVLNTSTTAYTATKEGAASVTGATVPPNSLQVNGAASFASPLAFVFLSLAALVTLH